MPSLLYLMYLQAPNLRCPWWFCCCCCCLNFCTQLCFYCCCYYHCRRRRRRCRCRLGATTESNDHSLSVFNVPSKGFVHQKMKMFLHQWRLSIILLGLTFVQLWCLTPFRPGSTLWPLALRNTQFRLDFYPPESNKNLRHINDLRSGFFFPSFLLLLRLANDCWTSISYSLCHCFEVVQLVVVSWRRIRSVSNWDAGSQAIL